MIATILTFAIILIVLVVIHEAGHFFAAKIMGIKVEEFGFGLPPRAWGKKIGETIYSVNWLPIGGFVRLYGEDALHPEQVKKERSRAFFSKKPWQRSIVLTAGVTMNFLLGWFLISYLFTQGVLVPSDKVMVEAVDENSPAQEAGLIDGDEIVSLVGPDGSTTIIDSSEDLINNTNKFLDQEVMLEVNRNGSMVDIALIPRSNPPEGQGAMGIVVSSLVEKKYSVTEAPIKGLAHVFEIIKLTASGIGSSIAKLVTLRGDEAEIAGPLGIGKLVGEARRFGFIALIELTAILSINLALINVLPFPALDGGRLAFVVFEGITGKKMKPQWETHLHQIGMIILLGLLLVVTINDILNFKTG